VGLLLDTDFLLGLKEYGFLIFLESHLHLGFSTEYIQANGSKMIEHCALNVCRKELCGFAFRDL